MSDVVLVAIISGIVGPSVLAGVGYVIHRSEKREDRAREDLVAARLLAAGKTTDEKLDVIHGLVNSSLTQALQGELDATRRTVVLLKLEAGAIPTTEAAAEIAAAETRIVELATTIEERAAQATAAEQGKV